MPKIVKSNDPTKQSGRMQPPSSIMLGRTQTDYTSIATSAYKIEGDHAEVFKGPSTAGDREKVLKFVVGSHFVLGDEKLDYNTSKQQADTGYIGGGPSKFDKNMLKTLRASSLKFGSDKTVYLSQSKKDFVNNFAGPNKLYRGQDVRSGEAFKFGDEESTYQTEQRTNFLDRTAEGEEINEVEEGSGLSGRAIPPSNVYFGSVPTDYRSTSISQRSDPGMSGRQKSVNVTGLLREDHVVLGDDAVDYSKKY